MEQKIIHLFTPCEFRSIQGCCERCGKGIHRFESNEWFVDDEDRYTQEVAEMHDAVLCKDIK